MRSSTTFLSLALLAGAAGAQNGDTGPGLSRRMGTSTSFDITKPPFTVSSAAIGANIQQVSCQHLSSDSPGEYTTTLSIEKLVRAYGGDGLRLGLVLCKFDVNTGHVALTTQANALNLDNHHQFALQIEPGKGRYAVFDRSDAQFNYVGLFFSARADASSAFPAPVQVTNVNGLTLGFADPALGYVGGKLKLFYVGVVAPAGRGIYMDDLDITNVNQPKAVGSPVLVELSPPGREGRINSPAPLTGPDGDVEGLWLADRVGDDNDMYFSNDLDPKSPPVGVFVAPLWQSNGGVAGGLFLSGDQTTQWKQAAEAEGAWLLGDTEPVGSVIDVFGGAYNNSPPRPVITAVLVSPGIGRPFTAPGIFGQLVLTITSIDFLGLMVHDANQMGQLSLLVPNDRSLSGLRLAIQGLSIQGNQVVNTLTNNAWLTIR